MSWTQKPMPHEKCSCGAEMFCTALSLEGQEMQRASFRAAHDACRRPQTEITSEMVERAAEAVRAVESELLGYPANELAGYRFARAALEAALSPESAA